MRKCKTLIQTQMRKSFKFFKIFFNFCCFHVEVLHKRVILMMPIACNAMFVMKSIASVWLSFDFVNRNLEERRKFGRDYNKRATFRRGWVQLWESFLLRKQRDSREPQRMEGRRSVGKMVIINDGPLLGKGVRSRTPYLWWHNTWTALHSYATYTWWYNRISNIKFLTLFILFREIPQGVNYWCHNQLTVT